MNKFVYGFILAVFASYFWTIATEIFAKRFNAISKGGFRRNLSPVPLLGGFALFATVLVLYPIFKAETADLTTLAVCLPIIIAGVWDDIFELRAKPKMLMQIFACSLWFYFTPQEKMFLDIFELPTYVTYAISVFWLVGIMNAINMIDGMDGLAPGFGFLASIGIFFLPGQFDRALVILFAGACLGFLFRNFVPAKIYLGDSGSQIIGFMLGIILLQWKPDVAHRSMIFVPLFLLAYPQMEAVLSIARRVKLGSSPVMGDKEHLHHQFRKMGMSVKDTWKIFMFITLATVWAANNLARIEVSVEFFSILVNTTFIFCVLLFCLMQSWQHFAKRVSHVGQSFIQKYFPLQKTEFDPQSGTRAIVLDLFPYYHELQTRGVEHISAFINDISILFSQNCVQSSKYWSIGSYTLIVLETGPELDKAFKNKIIQNFFQLLDTHGLRKSESLTPWGLHFYSKDKLPELVQKFNLTSNEPLRNVS